MVSRFFKAIFLLKIVCAQIDGEFWWLNDNFANYMGVEAPAPIFENLSEIDNDETAKIVFREDSFGENSNKTQYKKSNKLSKKTYSEEVSERNIRWPGEEKVFNASIKHIRDDDHAIEDKLIFKFPDEAFRTKSLTNITTSLPVVTNERNQGNISQNNTVFYNEKLTFDRYDKENFSESVCTYMKKVDCYRNKGVTHFVKKNEIKTVNERFICCILPLKTRTENISSKIWFPDTMKQNRLKRSKNVGQGLRNILLSHNYPRHISNAKPAMPITYDDEYEDPYVNIKNNKNPTSHHKQEPNLKYEYNNDDYQDDYPVEIPKPGLTGLYSETNDNPEYGGPLSYDDDDDDDEFGYAVINPRIGNKKTKKPKPHKPTRLSIAADEAYGEDNPTISFHSDPNFNILQDFKLPNLTRKKKLKSPRSTTTESFSLNDGEETTIKEEFDRLSDATNNDENRQVYKGCGKSAKQLVTSDNEIDFTEKGSHPWLALLVPTHKQNKLLCYASLIHPRAAITAGDCVHSTAPGDVTLIAGLWNLNERPPSGRRIVTPHFHPKYITDELSNNLAILHWKRPLTLGVNVQPICLAKPSFYHECVFVGWGGFDQAIRPRSRWQRTTVHNCKDHTALIGIDIPKESFCASVKSLSTVTGLGGSLVCRIEGSISAVGVAVSRDSTLILLPIYDWVTSPSISHFTGPNEE